MEAAANTLAPMPGGGTGAVVSPFGTAARADAELAVAAAIVGAAPGASGGHGALLRHMAAAHREHADSAESAAATAEDSLSAAASFISTAPGQGCTEPLVKLTQQLAANVARAQRAVRGRPVATAKELGVEVFGGLPCQVRGKAVKMVVSANRLHTIMLGAENFASRPDTQLVLHRVPRRRIVIC